MQGGDNGETTPMPMNPDPPDPPADNPPPPAPSFSDINGLTSAQRLLAINVVANTDSNGVTQSTEAQDSVSAVTDSSGNLMFHVVNEERVAVRVDNSNANWSEIPRPLSTFNYIFDKDTGASKTLAEYENGDFYAVTGFWYRSPADFGVFVDGSPRTVDLPTTGGANYRGNIGGQYWGDVTGSGNTDAPEIFGNFIGNINLQAFFPPSLPGELFLNGDINIPAVNPLSIININFSSVSYDNGNGVFNTHDSICLSGCGSAAPDNSVINARFVGNPVTNAAGDANSGGWPAGMIGTFGVDGLSIGNSEVDILGFFGAIHEDLCAATASGGSAAFCTK